MKTIRKKINKEIKESIRIRELAFDMPYEQGQELRKQQIEKFNKIDFLKKLNNAIEKVEYKDKNGKTIIRKKREVINNIRIGIRINDELFAKFKQKCNSQNKHFSKVLREFMERYIEENEK